MLYEAALEIVRQTVADLAKEYSFLVTMSQEEYTAMCLRHGLNINDPTTSKVFEEMVGQNLPCAQCVRGKAAEEYLLNSYGQFPKNLRAVMSHETFMGIAAEMRGQIFVYHEVLTHTLEALNNAEIIALYVKSFIGHELRHSVQESWDISYFGTADILAYGLQPYELDAYAFQYAILNGEAAVEDYATFVPTQAQLDRVIKQFEQIAAAQKTAA